MNQQFYQRSLMLIKPDGIQRGLIGAVISKIQKLGLKIIAMKFYKPERQVFQKHYAKHSNQQYFQSLIQYMIRLPVVSIVWEGPNAIQNIRRVVAGNNKNYEHGTIRATYSMSVCHFLKNQNGKVANLNVCHASDSTEEANRQIKLWFPQLCWEELNRKIQKDKQNLQYQVIKNPQ